MLKHYILNEKHEPVVVELETWAIWFTLADRTVKKTQVGEVNVSTVFLGIDHNFLGGKPILFETMCFCRGDSEWDEYQERYSTWAEAEEGHRRIVKEIEDGKHPR